MIALVEDRLADLESVCQRYAVRRLAVFGSAASGQFRLDASDLDFLVEFTPLPPIRWAECYFGLLLEIEQLFGRSVDLVDAAAIRNPYFAQSVNASQEVLYAAA